MYTHAHAEVHTPPVHAFLVESLHTNSGSCDTYKKEPVFILMLMVLKRDVIKPHRYNVLSVPHSHTLHKKWQGESFQETLSRLKES